MKKSVIISATAIMLALCGMAQARPYWYLVTDREETMPLAQVDYLLATDTSDRFAVVGTERTIHDVRRITFEKREYTGVSITYAGEDNDLAVLAADKCLRISGLRAAATEARILTADGRTVATHSIPDGTKEAIIPTAELGKGVYLLSVRTPDGALRSVKFIKK